MAPVNHSNADSNKDKKVPRPMNCFIIFRREKQREILSKCPGLNHRVLSKIISRLWKALPEEMKKVYKLKARKQKEEHQQQYPGYKYAPAPRRSTARRKYTVRSSSESSALASERNEYMERLLEDSSAFNDAPAVVVVVPEASNKAKSRFTKKNKASKSSKSFNAPNGSPIPLAPAPLASPSSSSLPMAFSSPDGPIRHRRETSIDSGVSVDGASDAPQPASSPQWPLWPEDDEMQSSPLPLPALSPASSKGSVKEQILATPSKQLASPDALSCAMATPIAPLPTTTSTMPLAPLAPLATINIFVPDVVAATRALAPNFAAFPLMPGTLNVAIADARAQNGTETLHSLSQSLARAVCATHDQMAMVRPPATLPMPPAKIEIDDRMLPWSANPFFTPIDTQTRGKQINYPPETLPMTNAAVPPSVMMETTESPRSDATSDEWIHKFDTEIMQPTFIPQFDDIPWGDWTEMQ